MHDALAEPSRAEPGPDLRRTTHQLPKTWLGLEARAFVDAVSPRWCDYASISAVVQRLRAATATATAGGAHAASRGPCTRWHRRRTSNRRVEVDARRSKLRAWADRAPRDAARRADAGQAHGDDPARPVLRAQVDGFRSIVFRDGDEVEIGSRKERPMTHYFPEVVEAVRRSFPPRAVIDGEIVVAGDGGLDFWALQQRIHPAASRVDAARERDPGQLHRLRPARARRRRSHERAVRATPRRARAGAGGRGPADPRHADHPRRADRPRLVRALQGAGWTV